MHYPSHRLKPTRIVIKPSCMILMEKSQIMYGYTLLVPIVPIAGTNAGTEHNIMLNRTSCAQVHELPQSHCGDKHCFHDCIYIYMQLNN